MEPEHGKNITTSFNSTQFALLYGNGVEATYWTLARNKIIYNSIKKAGLTDCRFIEVGCGRGIMIKSFLKKNIDCFGVELADIDVVSGVEDKVITGKDALDFDEAFRQKFNAIMLLDVIEHIENDVEFIRKLLQAYGNVQYLVIAVPARKEIWSNFDEFNGHFRRYDLKMMRMLMETLNFEISESKYFFNLIYFSIWLQNKFGIKRKLKMATPGNPFSKMANRFLASYFILEHALMPGNMYGSSIICIVRKKK